MARARSLETSAADFLPDKRDLASLRKAAAGCRGCPLFAGATQTVFGQGPADARIFFVGEQPGDQEDKLGEPFVGPAGRVFDETLADVGIERGNVYVTNAVKHFKYTLRGKRRMHAKPDAREQAACAPWLHAELEAIRPAIGVCLGATAAQALLGRSFRLTQHFGEFQETPWTEWTLATYHPSAILRAPDAEMRDAMQRQFTADLKRVAKQLAKLRA